MNATTLRQWLGQITTGFAAAGGVATLLAVLTGVLTWQQAVAPLVSALVLAIWPEHKPLTINTTPVIIDPPVVAAKVLTP